MAEYIEREDAIRVVNGQSSLTMTRSSLIDEITKLPAADVAPVRHGRWKRYGKNLGECSECGEIVSVRSNYCPNCGAKMDGGDSNVDAIVDCFASVCPSGGHHDYRMVAIGSDEVGDLVNTYRCSKCGEEFKVKFVT